jgi:hypothetical protein
MLARSSVSTDRTLRLVEVGPLGKDTIRYFLFINGRWRWRPTKTMRGLGFGLVTMGRGGPGVDADGNPEASLADEQRAIALNNAWDRVRSGAAQAPARTTLKVYPAGSVGDAYQRAMALRKAERLAKGVVWTKEQESRDDWPRAWKWLEPAFGDCDPNTIIPEHFLRIDPVTGQPAGLMVEIEAAVSVTERHRVVKVWRALWARMRSMNGDYIAAGAGDPSKAIANTAPDPRNVIWSRHDVLVRVQRAWRMGYFGLAASIAVAWDSMCSPVDVRRLTPTQARGDASGIWFDIDRAKTGRAGVATLSPWSAAILRAYLAKLGGDPAPNYPIFRNRSGRAYSKDTLGDDFRDVREAVDKTDRRQLADMRRTGAVEGDAGGGSVTDQSNKMANTVAASNRLRKVYNPTNVVSARRFDEARVVGAQLLEQNRAKSVTAPDLVTLLTQNRRPKPLK